MADVDDNDFGSLTSGLSSVFRTLIQSNQAIAQEISSVNENLKTQKEMDRQFQQDQMDLFEQTSRKTSSESNRQGTDSTPSGFSWASLQGVLASLKGSGKEDRNEASHPAPSPHPETPTTSAANAATAEVPVVQTEGRRAATQEAAQVAQPTAGSQKEEDRQTEPETAPASSQSAQSTDDERQQAHESPSPQGGGQTSSNPDTTPTGSEGSSPRRFSVEGIRSAARRSVSAIAQPGSSGGGGEAQETKTGPDSGDSSEGSSSSTTPFVANKLSGLSERLGGEDAGVASQIGSKVAGGAAGALGGVGAGAAGAGVVKMGANLLRSGGRMRDANAFAKSFEGGDASDSAAYYGERMKFAHTNQMTMSSQDAQQLFDYTSQMGYTDRDPTGGADRQQALNFATNAKSEYGQSIGESLSQMSTMQQYGGDTAQGWRQQNQEMNQMTQEAGADGVNAAMVRAHAMNLQQVGMQSGMGANAIQQNSAAVQNQDTSFGRQWAADTNSSALVTPGSSTNRIAASMAGETPGQMEYDLRHNPQKAAAAQQRSAQMGFMLIPGGQEFVQNYARQHPDASDEEIAGKLQDYAELHGSGMDTAQFAQMWGQYSGRSFSDPSLAYQDYVHHVLGHTSGDKAKGGKKGKSGDSQGQAGTAGAADQAGALAQLGIGGAGAAAGAAGAAGLTGGGSGAAGALSGGSGGDSGTGMGAGGVSKAKSGGAASLLSAASIASPAMDLMSGASSAISGLFGGHTHTEAHDPHKKAGQSQTASGGNKVTVDLSPQAAKLLQLLGVGGDDPFAGSKAATSGQPLHPTTNGSR